MCQTLKEIAAFHTFSYILSIQDVNGHGSPQFYVPFDLLWFLLVLALQPDCKKRVRWITVCFYLTFPEYALRVLNFPSLHNASHKISSDCFFLFYFILFKYNRLISTVYPASNHLPVNVYTKNIKKKILRHKMIPKNFQPLFSLYINPTWTILFEPTTGEYKWNIR